jgi:hypothetical protein
MLSPQSSSGNQDGRFAFSPDAAARPEIYRDAVRAGFYNDNICHDLTASKSVSEGQPAWTGNPFICG